MELHLQILHVLAQNDQFGRVLDEQVPISQNALYESFDFDCDRASYLDTLVKLHCDGLVDLSTDEKRSTRFIVTITDTGLDYLREKLRNYK